MYSSNNVFIQKVKEKIPKNISVIDEVASMLGINYDAAYRRMNGKVAFNIDEVTLLAKKFDISLNELFEVGESNSYLVRETKPIESLNDFYGYFDSLYKELSPLENNPEASILFGARELPMFYFFNNPLLTRFKIYIWFTILKVTPLSKRIDFKDFIISDKMIESAKKVGKTYSNINLTEMWSFGATNNILQQLLYLYRMRQIEALDAVNICDSLKIELKKIEETTFNGIENKTRKFELYSNELIMMNNSMIFKYKDKMQFGYPYALLKFFIIDNQKACKAQETYIKEQMRYARCITNTSTKDHASFFNHKYDKINQLLAVINNEENKPLFL